MATRVSINLINKGLPAHYDNVLPNQPDPSKCRPGISVSVHLGAPDDSVFLGFSHEDKLHEIKPGMMVLFPGYVLEHKTVRPIVAQPAARRYSLVLFFQFKPECVKKWINTFATVFIGFLTKRIDIMNNAAQLSAVGCSLVF